MEGNTNEEVLDNRLAQLRQRAIEMSEDKIEKPLISHGHNEMNEENTRSLHTTIGKLTSTLIDYSSKVSELAAKVDGLERSLAFLERRFEQSYLNKEKKNAKRNKANDCNSK